MHEQEGEIEISPFKTRAKMLTCEQCGARVTSVLVAEYALNRAQIDWQEFRQLARLCPRCRRKRTAARLTEGRTLAAQAGYVAGTKKAE
jgi:5-methylcytosine-specific restriction endonuclease McrA